ncbi:hypothetical protein JXA02_07610 [candidate division KSB1 bacterium]|nr:hypothetical protein [candidate division KSB1 bacterium]RQW06355.1 MAG: hypothetical protein EH222_08855 [candidate division KSB1 bacterium]
MNILKNIIIAFVVLALSVGIFFLLIKDQDVKNNILRSTLEMFGDELLAMVPEGQERDALAKRIDDFILKAENNEISEEQVQVTLARALNMQMAPEKPSPQELRTLLEVSLDTTQEQRIREFRGEKGRERKSQSDIRADRLARNYQEMVDLRNELQKMCQEDSACRALYQRAMFVADDGLRFLVDSSVTKQYIFANHPDLRRLLEEMSADDLVKFKDFTLVPEVVQQGVVHFAPMIPESIRVEFVKNMNVNIDSLVLSISHVPFQPDSLSEFIYKIIKIAESFE